MSYGLTYKVPKKPEGSWTIYVREDKDGAMWIGYGFEEVRVNYCPFTGTKAKKQMIAHYGETKDLEGNIQYYKEYTD